MANLAQPSKNRQDNTPTKRDFSPGQEFDRHALLSDNARRLIAQRKRASHESDKTSQKPGTDNMLGQNLSSADLLGNVTLSTYAWDWASYITLMKIKLYEVWRSPPAYYVLGMIHGNTLTEIVIDRQGNLKRSKVLEHNGHNSLQLASENAIRNTFPLAPLPVDFPDDSLVIKLNLIYPEVNRRSN